LGWKGEAYSYRLVYHFGRTLVVKQQLEEAIPIRKAFFEKDYNAHNKENAGEYS